MKYIKPQDVSPENSEKVLDFLNNAGSAEEIGNTIEIPDELDIGVKVGQRILDTRNKLGGFKNLYEVAEVPYVGPERFSEIILTLTQDDVAKSQKSMGETSVESNTNIGEYPVLVMEVVSSENSNYQVDIYSQLAEAVRKCSYGQTELLYEKSGPYVAESSICSEQNANSRLRSFALEKA